MCLRLATWCYVPCMPSSIPVPRVPLAISIDYLLIASACFSSAFGISAYLDYLVPICYMMLPFLCLECLWQSLLILYCVASACFSSAFGISTYLKHSWLLWHHCACCLWQFHWIPMHYFGARGISTCASRVPLASHSMLAQQGTCS